MLTDVMWNTTDRDQQLFFEGLSDKQADDFLNQYLLEMPRRLSDLQQNYNEAGGKESDLDLSLKSLEPLWSWVRSSLVTRELTEDEVFRLSQLPPAMLAYKSPPLSHSSLLLLSDTARYFGESLIQTIPGVRWAVCRTRIKRYIDRNQPVLKGLDSPGLTLGFNPMSAVKAAGLSDMKGAGSDRALIDIVDHYIKFKGS